jgi:hypothetical protein
MSLSVGSMPLIPSIVFNNTGHRQTNAMMKIFMSSPTPITTIANGSRAGGGMERRNSTIGDVARRSVRELPNAIPTTIAITTASQ